MKNKAYSDVRYVEELIGDETVDTIPPATMDAFRDHGKPRASIEENLDAAHATMDALKKSGVDMDAVTTKLVQQGVQLFADAFDQLLGAVEKKRVAFLGDRLNGMSWQLDGELEAAVKETTDKWLKDGTMRRVWEYDASVWTGADEAKWLGWLTIVDEQLANPEPLKNLLERGKSGGFSHVLLLGMGGSSLGPEVLEKTFGRQPGYPELLVLDSTDPQQIKTFESKIDLAKTLFVVSSKSGSTLEPNIFKQYFFERARSVLGHKAGEHFIAVTDPGSNMQKVAEADKFSGIYYGAEDHRRALFGAVRFRHGAGCGHGPRYGEVPCQHCGDGAGLRADGSGQPEPRLPAGRCAGHGGRARSRQSHYHRLAEAVRFRRLGGATDRRIDRQDRQRIDPCRPRGVGLSGCIR